MRQHTDTTTPNIRKVLHLTLSPKITSLVFAGLIVILALGTTGLGIYFLTLPRNIEVRINDYGRRPQCSSALEVESYCEATFLLQEDLQGPILVMYELHGFSSSNKNYLNSKLRKQLMGTHINQSSDAQHCYPFVTNAEMNVTRSWAGHKLHSHEVASPCGLAAKLFFRDRFVLTFDHGDPISIRTTSLTKPKYVREKNSQDTQWVDPSQESFTIWMKNTVALSVRKLYGIIEQPLRRGSYRLRIRNLSSYSSEVAKDFVLVKELHGLGDSRLIGTLCVGGGGILMTLMLVYLLLALWDARNVLESKR